MFQSGFQANHITETALVKVVNDIRIHLDAIKPSLLVFLALSAAFDTANHTILLNRLREHIGLSGAFFLTGFPLIFLTQRSLLQLMITSTKPPK